MLKYFIVFSLIVIAISTVIEKKKAEKKLNKQKQKQKEAIQRNIEYAQKKHELEIREEKAQRQLREIKTNEAIRNNPGSERYILEDIQTKTSAEILNITEFTPISKKRFVAFDLETTGINYGIDAIVEIAAVRVEQGIITDTFSQLVNPEMNIPSSATNVNHITNEMIVGKPTINEVLPAFLNFVGDDVLAAHNARFDLRFLSIACMCNKLKAPTTYFDTMALTRYWPEAINKKLSTLLKAAEIENNEAHRALGDAEAVAKLILKTNEKRKK